MQATFLAQQFVPIMFITLFIVLLSGFPVAFGLAATGLGLGFVGIQAGIFPAALFQALPLRIFGIMQTTPCWPFLSSRSWASSWSEAAWQRICWKPWDRCSARCAVAWPLR